MPLEQLFRKRRSQEGDPDPAPRPVTHYTTQPVRRGLLLLSSAALGGIAVALWNRRTLQALRREIEEGAPNSPGRAKDPGNQESENAPAE